jgi:hypothetical protein
VSGSVPRWGSRPSGAVGRMVCGDMVRLPVRRPDGRGIDERGARCQEPALGYR